MTRNNHITPILDAVKAMHSAADADDDAATPGYDPYRGRFRRPIPVPGEFTPQAKHEADQILACYDSQLSLADTK